MYYLAHDIGVATLESLLMVIISGTLSIILGGLLGMALYHYQHSKIYKGLNHVVNIGRAIPFMILLIAVLPLTRLITGTSIGPWAACVPLTLGAIPLFARYLEQTFLGLPHTLVLTAKVLDAKPHHLLWTILLPEAMPTLIHHMTTLLIQLLGYATMAGAIGGGGLGDIAIQYGYQQYNTTVMLITVVLLVALVTLIQTIGGTLARTLNRNHP